MSEPKRHGALRLSGRLALALAASAALAACSGGGSNPFGGGNNPFGGASDFDMTFLSASSTWDLDKNGIVTCDEWKQYATTALKEADVDRDGALTQQEWSTMARNDRLFSAANLDYYDANNDNKVTVEELTGKQNLAFKLLDKNNDCQIGHDEKVNVYSTIKPKEKEVDQANPGRGGPPN